MVGGGDGKTGWNQYENAIEYEIAGLSKFMTIYTYCIPPMRWACVMRREQFRIPFDELPYINCIACM